MATLARYLARPNMFVTFVNIEKLGIHPTSKFVDTPTGIYAYPLAEAYAAMEQKMVRFAGDRKFICLFEGQGEILDLQNYTHADYEDDMERLLVQWKLVSLDNEKFATNMLLNWDEKIGGAAASPGAAIWQIVEKIAGRAEKLYQRKSMVISNSIWRRLGYSGVVDHGDRIIHSHEPEQAVFFSRDACRIIDFLINDHLPGHTPAFPARGEKKIKGFVDRSVANPDDDVVDTSKEY